MQQAFRGSIFHCISDPGPHGDEAAVEHIDDGLLVVEDGRVTQIGTANELLPALPEGVQVEDHSAS